jgi:glycosyltransferase involved in cell wall biosynthesis
MAFKLLVIIPTRNRPDLAQNAIRSVLTQSEPDFDLIVSDNSTESESREELAKFCAAYGDSRLTYLNPPESCSMTKHWEWAIREGMKLSTFTHVTYLTDRRVFKTAAFEKLRQTTEIFPAKLVTYHAEAIYDERETVRLEQTGTTGKLFELTSQLLIEAFLTLDWVSPFPAMLNSCVPRPLMEKIAAHHVQIFSSIAPDFNFGFKVLDLEDSILYLDETLLVAYGNKFSNGLSIAKGTQSTNKAAADFTSTIETTDIHVDSVLPFGSTIVDAVLNEYFYILKNAKRRSFPIPDDGRYKAYVIRNILYLENQVLRDELLKDLRRQFGVHYYPLYLRGRFPFRRYIRRIIEEVMLKIHTSDESWVEKRFDTYEKALEFAINNSAPSIATLRNFYKRTSIIPSRAHIIREESHG